MRFVAAIVVSVALLGSVGLCQWWLVRDVKVSIAREVEEHGHAGEPDGPAEFHALTVTAGFDSVDDPFAVTLDADEAAVRILVRSAEQTLLAVRDDVRRGQQLSATGLALRGESVELYVEATPTAEEAQHPCPLRVELYRDGALCADETVWSEGKGQKLARTVRLALQPKLETLDRGL